LASTSVAGRRATLPVMTQCRSVAMVDWT
jgi:hypothetical protein